MNDTIHLIYIKSKNYPLPVCGRPRGHYLTTEDTEVTTCKMCKNIYAGLIRKEKHSTTIQVQRKIKKLEKNLRKAIELLKKITNDNDCFLDINGYCLVHHTFMKPCPHKESKKFLKKVQKNT
jgi:hypothetical protein